MLPHFNSHPYHPNQIQTDGTSASAAQQVMPSNHCQGNHSSILPNSVQIQSHMGLINPQIVIPFNNSNTHWTSGTVAMPNRPISLSSACFMNATNHHPPLQNGVPLLGSAGVMSYPGQCQGVFGNQNLNSVTTFPVQNMHSGQTMNTTNPSQPPESNAKYESVCSNANAKLCSSCTLWSASVPKSTFSG
ncbi:hypothetical protein F0562_029552 [Nyssa sinensis]|uniref:Uncharacterized protein n=1 Tax=Nyssa sinensis TaxID=561372 RepID=A0A5J5B3F3_9ASTE|nr:hypothetical protein F0562_029552 [Nyssa sinensis]